MNAPKGKPGTIPVVITRLDDGEAPLELRVIQAPAGVKVETATVRPGGTLADIKVAAEIEKPVSIVLEAVTAGKVIGQSHPIVVDPAARAGRTEVAIDRELTLSDCSCSRFLHGARGLTVYPPSIELTGRNATQVLAVSLEGRDVTAECTFAPADRALLTVSKEALVTAQADGKTTLKVSCGGSQAVAPVKIAAAREEPKLSFVKDVVPIFTMAGCAGSNCHGSIRGQNGFKLSLFGYEPDLDFKAIGPRIDRDHPEQSLILLKPTMQKPHGGGVRFAVDSLQYRTILDWIKGGASYDSAGSPRIATLTVYPPEVTLTGEGATQQLIATATYTDGTRRDVTHLVAYSSNGPDTVQVSADGKIQGLKAGETAVMVRTLGQAVAAKIYVPQAPLAHAFPNVTRNNYMDEWVFSKLKRLNIEPSGLSSDEHFLRRVYLDTVGLLPTQKEAEEFLDSKEPDKRAKLIDALLQRPEFSEYWALKYTELFRAGTREAGPKGARIIYEWVKQSFLENKPYDKMVTELLLSQGAHLCGPGPSSFYNVSFDSNAPDHATNVSQLFLGTRIECAKCHNHPWEKWTQEDFYGFAAFFARVKIKEIHDDDENEHYYAEEGEVINPKTNKAAAPKYLDGAVEPDEQDKDVRVNLAKWMTAPENPFFSRAIVNRVWKTYLGRGLVEEVDDFRVTNPPTQSGPSGCAGQGPLQPRLRPAASDPHDSEFAYISAQRRADRIQSQRRDQLLALLHEANDRRSRCSIRSWRLRAYRRSSAAFPRALAPWKFIARSPEATICWPRSGGPTAKPSASGMRCPTSCRCCT